MNLRKITGIVFALVLFISCSNSANKNNNSLLWKVSGNGLAAPSYLFGTHHLVPVSFLDSIHGIHEAFESTQQVVGELDMGNMAELQMKMMQHAMLPTGVTYESLLGAEDVKLLDSTLTKLVGIGLNQLGTLKPAMLTNLISIAMYQQYYPEMAGGENIDLHFQQEASKRSRPVIGLEAVEDQTNVLLNLQPVDRQAEMLMCTVKHPELLKQQMDKLQVAYHAQDIDALAKLYEEKPEFDPCPSTQDEKDAMNKNRNMKWLEKLPSIMQDKPSFIAVGCLHLAGKDGLIEGLRKMGYTVEAITR